MTDYDRHGVLIDKMLLFGLTAEEKVELEQIRGRIDDREEAWYASVVRMWEGLYPDDPARGPLIEPRSAGTRPEGE